MDTVAPPNAIAIARASAVLLIGFLLKVFERPTRRPGSQLQHRIGDDEARRIAANVAKLPELLCND
jgi:hypothetical protein